MSIHPQITVIGSDPSTRLRMERLARSLLEQLLTRAARFQDTPLQFEIDSAGVALAAWSSFWPDVPPEDRHLLSDGKRLCAAVDGLVEQAFEEADARNVANGQGLAVCGTASHVFVTRDAKSDSPLARISEWLDRLCGALRLAHPRALEVIRLRVEGYAARDIAIRLGTGVHLVRRILADARSAVERTQQED